MKILFCSAEVAPFATTGGLGEVLGALPLALAKRGHHVMIVMPQYHGITGTFKRLSSRVSLYFVKHKRYFDRNGLYGNQKGDYIDNLERFSFFCRQSLSLAVHKNFKPDILHCHDWHTGLIPLYLKTFFRDEVFFKKTKTLFTIHNMAYQGLFSLERFRKLGLPPEVLSSRGLGFHGKGSCLKAGLVYSDFLSTVSPGYASEIQGLMGCGLEGTVRKRRKALVGILNGINPELWNPSTDSKIHHFSHRSVQRKKLNKRSLQHLTGLKQESSIPLFGMVCRLVEQKGLGTIKSTFQRLMGLGIQLVVLGKGDKKFQQFFRQMRKRFRSNFSYHEGFDAGFAKRIYASSDFFLMPSRFEPCGLGQLISFRYGTVPLVNQTGGLKDTVVDVTRSPRQGNGVCFYPPTSKNFLMAIKRALSLFEKKVAFNRVQSRIMQLDYSWKRSALGYERLYKRILK